MPHLRLGDLRLLDQCLTDVASVSTLRAALEKIEKCAFAVQRKLNLADVLRDPANQASLAKCFGNEGVASGLQTILKIALGSHHCRSFTLHKDLATAAKFEAIYRAVGGWRQFDVVLTALIPDAPADQALILINPTRQGHWKKLKALPAGTLINVYIKATGKAGSLEQETLAGQRYEAVFDMIQVQADQPQGLPAAAVRIDQRKAAPRRPTGAKPKPAQPSPSTRYMSTSGPPTLGFRVVISKMDTFVHAGNAQLIVSHLREYQGGALLYVLRGEKKKVQLDADSIWSAEIRNGETVLFEFFGPNPTEEFLKELAAKVNKYTQMDKINHG